ncbi:hypothetical protein TrVE_jg2674 [Triparma verrucosa]|uniref:tRNA(Ile)-lysidine synthetase n=1 Tax=Triparma verrucosa TaxID=1606542 RepID=A0A9W7BDH4_9STRA|nr:hypothetical protein TrVE_jg2674 [Triparma verrucosa]
MFLKTKAWTPPWTPSPSTIQHCATTLHCRRHYISSTRLLSSSSSHNDHNDPTTHLPTLLTNSLSPYLQTSPPPRIALSCSGGVDSLSLLKAYLSVSPSLPPLTVVHFNHLTRPPSSHSHDLHCITLLTSPSPLPTLLTHTSPHPTFTPTLSSSWRKSVLSSYDLVLTGHHLSDSVESQILKLGRGVSILNLHGIKPVSFINGTTYLRPFINVSKDVLREYLKPDVYSEDESNGDERKGKRNWVRNRLLKDWRAVEHDIERKFGNLEEEVEEFREFFDKEVEGRYGGKVGGEGFKVDGCDYGLIDKLTFRRYVEEKGAKPSRDIFNKVWSKVKQTDGKGKKWTMDLGRNFKVEYEKGHLRVM